MSTAGTRTPLNLKDDKIRRFVGLVRQVQPTLSDENQIFYPEDRLDYEVNIDSIQRLNLMSRCENEFGFRIPDEAYVDDWTRLGRWVSYIQEHGT